MINTRITTGIKRRGIIIPAKAMPRPLSLLGWVLILIKATIPSTKATGNSGGPNCRPPNEPKNSKQLPIAQTREAIARGSLCSGPVKFDWSFDGDMGGGGIGGGNEFTVEP